MFGGGCNPNPRERWALVGSRSERYEPTTVGGRAGGQGSGGGAARERGVGERGRGHPSSPHRLIAPAGVATLSRSSHAKSSTNEQSAGWCARARLGRASVARAHPAISNYIPAASGALPATHLTQRRPELVGEAARGVSRRLAPPLATSSLLALPEASERCDRVLAFETPRQRTMPSTMPSAERMPSTMPSAERRRRCLLPEQARPASSAPSLAPSGGTAHPRAQRRFCAGGGGVTFFLVTLS